MGVGKRVASGCSWIGGKNGGEELGTGRMGEGEYWDRVLLLLNTIFDCYLPFTLPSLDSAATTGKRMSGRHILSSSASIAVAAYRLWPD